MSISRNVVANYVGRVWIALLNIALVPLYIRYLGIEAFGLVGFFSSLQAVLAIFDFGLGTTLNRELSRCSDDPGSARRMRELTGTLERIYWALAAVITLTVALLAPLAARYWINAQSLSTATVTRSVMLMGLAGAAQWTMSFYGGGLLGLQRQVTYNAVLIAVVTTRALGALFVLEFVSSSVTVFFGWQAGITCAGCLAMRTALLRAIPRIEQAARFQVHLIKEVWKFAAGMTTNSVLWLLLTQLDKLILVRLLPLRVFGYYSLATSIAAALAHLSAPVFMALFPDFSRSFARSNGRELSRLYHLGAQALSLIIIPPAIVLAVFAPEVLFAWTRDRVIAERAAVLLTLLVCGYGVNCLVGLPYLLQIASGWTSLTVYTNLAFAAVLTPLLILLTPTYGAIGAAALWLALNLGYMVGYVQALHSRLLPQEKWRWYVEDLGLPLAGSLAVAVAFRQLVQPPRSVPGLIFFLGVIWLMQVILSGLLAGELRPRAFRWIRSLTAGEAA